MLNIIIIIVLVSSSSISIYIVVLLNCLYVKSRVLPFCPFLLPIPLGGKGER